MCSFADYDTAWKAGIQAIFFCLDSRLRGDDAWMPAFAGMTGKTPRPLK